MGPVLKLSRLHRQARGRWHKRRVYESGVDVFKAFYLLASTPERPRAKAPLIRGFWVKVAGVQTPAWLRCGSSDFLVFQEIFENGEYRLIERWNLPADAVVMDLGGNVGLASAYFGAALPLSKIVVVEPDHANCASIAQTCGAMIASGRLRIVEAFAAATDGVAGINRASRSWAFKMLPTPENGSDERIPRRCVSTLMREHGLEKIDLLKCDIEGTEAELFANCKDWIGRVDHLIVETHAPYRVADLARDLREADWSFDVLSEFQDDKLGLAFFRRNAAAAT